MTTTKQRGSFFAKATLLFIALVFLSNFKLAAQANSVRTGVTFNWADTQTNLSDPATLESIEIGGASYNTFVVPSNYELTRLGLGGHNGNHILQNGFQIANSSSLANWDDLALDAYQSINLNHYFESNSNGDNFCENYTAISTTTQIQTISYNPGIPSNPEGILAVTERGGNNCIYIEVMGTPVGGGAEQLLGRTFVRNQGNLTGVKPQEEPLPNSDYWSSGRNNENNQIIGIALYKLSDLAPIGSTITSIKYYAASSDNGDGKFFLMQTYAQDDYFDPEFEEVFNGDVGANDNVPSGSSYTYFANAQPLNGTVVVNTDGTFTYTPNPGFTGTDVFEVQVCLPAPNQSVCDTSVVSLNVKSGVSINDASANEGDNLTYTISINDPSSEPIVFDISYTNNSTTNADYSGPATVTLPANASSVTFDVAAIDDDWLEETQTFNAIITDASNTVTIIDGTGLGTILDTDEATVSTSNYDVDEDAGIIQLRVFLTPSSGRVGVEQAFTVDLTVNSSGISFPATDGSDYNTTTATVSFPANSPAGTEFFIPLTILDDNIVEASEQVIQRLSNVSFNLIGLAGPGGMVRIHDNDTATITLEDKTVNENVGTTSYQFVLNGDVQDAFNISYRTDDNTALEPGDYTETTGNITFNGNNTEIETISIPIIDDNVIEPSEIFNVISSYTGVAPSITNGQAPNIVFSNNPGEITIQDNDAVPGTGISFDNTNVVVNEDAGTATFTVRLTGNVSEGFTLDYNTADDSAAQPGDYSSVSGTLTFNGNDNEFYDIVVPITDDNVHELTQSFNLNLSNLSTSLITINDPTATGTINDDDSASIFTKFVVVFENDLIYNLEVELNNDVEHSFTVDFETFGNENVPLGATATVGSDYAANINTTLTFQAGSSAGTILSVPLTVIEDSLIEPSETIVQVLDNISDPTIGILSPNRTFTINDDDSNGSEGLSIVQTDVIVTEGAGVTATFDVTLTGDFAAGFDVDFSTAFGSATATDFTPITNGTISFTGNDGEVQQIVVNILNDGIIEPQENYSVVLNSTTNPLVPINDSTANGIINDDDSNGSEGLSIVQTDVIVTEGAGVTATFDVTLTGDFAAGFDVDFSTAFGSATATDFTPITNGTISFTGNDGEVQQIVVNILNDGIIEPQENYSVVLNSTTNPLVPINDSTANGIINDDDSNGSEGLSIVQTDVIVTEGAGVTATFDVTLTGDFAAGFDVDFSTAFGSATATDFTPITNGTISFTGNDGEVQQIVVNILNDGIIEPQENYSVVLNS
ncbi:Calx-beta domain-containing protein, partial [uncultured Croceitalea sp.]|uniref:Calx-beta domain-containing protein n=4 Tax=uncultured Croceitalea sp. TaxID=1798908 RepID=UPI003305BA6F